MSFLLTPVFWILLLTALVASIAAMIAWPKRKLPGGTPFFYMLIVIALYALIASMEAASVSMHEKIFWSQFEYLTSTATAILFLLFAAEYTGKTPWLTWKARIILCSFPLLHFLLAATNHIHHQVWKYFTPSPAGQNIIIYHHGPVFYYITFFIYVLLAAATTILIMSGQQASVLQRRQTRIIIVAAMIPWLFSLIYILNLSPVPGLNLIPISFLFTGLMILVAFYTYKFLHLVPVARDKLLEVMWDGMIVTDSEFRVVDINEKTLALFDVHINDVLGKQVQIFLPEEKMLEKLKQEKQTIHFYHQLMICEKHCYYEVRGSAVLNKSKNPIGFLLVIHDITKRRQIEVEREALIDELHQANETKNRFFSIISHDLKNPFNTISGYVQLIRENWDDLPKEELLSLTDELYLSMKTTNAFLENLLSWARSQTGALKFHLKPEPLISLADSVLELTMPAASKKNINLSVNIPEDVWVEADANITCTVMRNLISNAIKFTQERGHIQVNAIPADGTIYLQIIDDGVGIDPLIQKDLFKLDKTVSTSGTHDEQGSGLGLILCKEFIEKQGGTITVESEPGKGSTFTFTLTQAEPFTD